MTIAIRITMTKIMTLKSIIDMSNTNNAQMCLIRQTSDAGSQYRCGRVGRGIQPPSKPHSPPSYTQTHTKSIQNACFSTFWLDHYGPTDGLSDGPTGGQTKPLIELSVRNKKGLSKVTYAGMKIIMSIKLKKKFVEVTFVFFVFKRWKTNTCRNGKGFNYFQSLDWDSVCGPVYLHP